ncbi:hypothetical protein [Absidia glauca]|uniref:Uncharacterized protein n=1 Tax=Absidia glauca TaxID=4829 RepID=A0A168T473_ABSGL|nr:hypothetical protein [Absidia glauca]
MDYCAWLKDDSEFPPLGPSSSSIDGLQDYVVVEPTGDDTFGTMDDWQLVQATYADIVNSDTRPPVARPKPSPPVRRRHYPMTTNHPDDDAMDDNDPFDLALTRKSRARRRYRGDAWIYQHRVTVLVRLGYGSSIQAYRTDVPLEEAHLNMEGPVDPLTFIHCWRYICKEDPEPEVDRLRKATVRCLLTMTS